MVEDDQLLDQAVDVYLTGLKGLGTFISQPSAEYSLSFEQYMILRTITKHPGIKLMEIANQRRVTRSAISRQVRVLLTNEYVIQKPDPQDRRRQALTATMLGNHVEKRISDKVRQRFSKWVSVFGNERGKQLLDLLAEFNEQIVRGELDDKEQQTND